MKATSKDTVIDILALDELQAIDRINNRLTVIGWNTTKKYIIYVPERLSLDKFTVPVRHAKLKRTAIVRFDDD